MTAPSAAASFFCSDMTSRNAPMPRWTMLWNWLMLMPRISSPCSPVSAPPKPVTMKPMTPSTT